MSVIKLDLEVQYPDCNHLEIEAVDPVEFGNIKVQQKLMEREWPMQNGCTIVDRK